MRLTITIDMDSDAFSAAIHRATEAARILRNLADRIEHDSDMGELDDMRLRDINGNTVGRTAVTTE